MKVLQKTNITPAPLCKGSELKWSDWNDVTDIDDNQCVIFNTLTRDAVLADKMVVKDWEKLPSEDLLILTGTGILVSRDNDERKVWIENFNTAKRDKSYIDLTILLTHDCQFKCQYCFEGEKDKTKLSSETEEDILLFLESQKKTCKMLRVTWFGGEPLLAFSRLRSLSELIISFCDANGIEYIADITTNGYALTKVRFGELGQGFKVKRYISL